MNLKKLIVFLVLSLFCIPTGFVFAEEILEIDEGKNLKFNFKGENTWYNDSQVYDIVNVGAGTKVILYSEWEYMYEGGGGNEYTYANAENLATLPIQTDGTIILNSGSELSIRNEYSLVDQLYDVSLQYKQDPDDEEDIDISSVSYNRGKFKYKGDKKNYENRVTISTVPFTETSLFTGNIVFENGDADTVLTFRKVSDVTSEDFILPEAKEGDTITEVEDLVTLNDENNIVHMSNNFIINSNRAVFNVEGGGADSSGKVSKRYVYLTDSVLSGSGTFVKQGKGSISLDVADATDLTGANSGGLGWSIEEGLLSADFQFNLGNSDIYIDNGGTLGLSSVLMFIKLDPSDIVKQIKGESTTTLKTNLFSNDILSSNGSISISATSQVELNGQLKSEEGKDALGINFVHDSLLKLSKQEDKEANNIKHFNIFFGNKDLGGGESNYLLTDVDCLADESVTATNGITEDCIEKETAFFELVLQENEDKEYSGSLKGEMYLRKLGTGTVTLSGNNTFTEGTYISEGGLMLATSEALGTGKIMFDGSSTTTYASLGVSKGGNIDLSNNIHVKKGAILDVADGQNLYLKGDLVRYDARPGCEAEFIKNGLGNAIIAEVEGVDKQVNISTFNITEGGFILDKGVNLDSYFSLDGQQAFLEIRENAAVKNNMIDIKNGDLIIFNDKCISSATAVSFYNTLESTESFSKFHIMSDSVLSDETIEVSSITIAKNIEFVVGSTTTAQAESDDTATAAVVTAQMNIFDFQSGADTVIVKSGDGKFVADGNGDFALDSLYVNGGEFRIENTTMTASGETLIDKGGIFSVSSTSHFTTTAADKKITVLDGGIGIYDENSIDENVAFVFLGTDSVNLSKLIIESSGVVIANDISVKAGLEIQNYDSFTFRGNKITFDDDYDGILAKSGAGTMTIDTADFRIKELRSLEGNLLVNSDINVSTISIRGEGALLSFDGLNKKINAEITEMLLLENDGTLSISTATVDVKTLDLTSSHVIINKDSSLNTTNANFNYSDINLMDASSVISATGEIYLMNESSVFGYGKLDAIVNVGNDSNIYVGSHKTTGENLKVKDITFESGSNLYIDIDDETGTSDKLEVLGDITVQKNVTLQVNFIGDDEDADGASSINFANDSSSDKVKEFEILTFNGNYNFANPTNEIFNIILSDRSLSATTSLVGNSIFLQIVQAWGDLYSIPGATKNQQEMIDLFNGLTADDVEAMRPLIDTIRGYYTTYVNTGDKSVFLNALQDLSGIFYANSFMTSAMLSKANILYNRLNENSDEREEDNRVWAQIYTNNFSVSEKDENPEFKNSIYGIIAGYDTIQDENLTFGVAGFYGQGELKQLDDKADFIDAGINVYGDYKVNEKIDVKGLIGYSMQDYDTTRKLRFNKQEITSKYATNTINLDLEAAYKFNLGERFLLKPLVGANCAIVSNGDIEEDGDSIQRLKIKKDTHSRAEARVGAGLQSISDSPFNWHVSAAIKHIISGSKFTTKSSFIDAPGYEFEIESTEVAGTSFSGLFGCSYDINENINISLDINADAGAVSQFGGNIGASYKW